MQCPIRVSKKDSYNIKLFFNTQVPGVASLVEVEGVPGKQDADG